VDTAQLMQPEAEMPGIDTGEFVVGAIAGDTGAFEQLYRQFSPRIYGLCLRMTGQREAAEDCTQESFIAAWKALPRFEQRSRDRGACHRASRGG